MENSSAQWREAGIMHSWWGSPAVPGRAPHPCGNNPVSATRPQSTHSQGQHTSGSVQGQAGLGLEQPGRCGRCHGRGGTG